MTSPQRLCEKIVVQTRNARKPFTHRHAHLLLACRFMNWKRFSRGNVAMSLAVKTPVGFDYVFVLAIVTQQLMTAGLIETLLC